MPKEILPEVAEKVGKLKAAEAMVDEWLSLGYDTMICDDDGYCRPCKAKDEPEIDKKKHYSIATQRETIENKLQAMEELARAA